MVEILEKCAEQQRSERRRPTPRRAQVPSPHANTLVLSVLEGTDAFANTASPCRLLGVLRWGLKPPTWDRTGILSGTEANVHEQHSFSCTAHSSPPLISLQASDPTAPWETCRAVFAQELAWIIGLTAAISQTPLTGLKK